jgi:glycosyltransferase involved in cell wall biosynthesis
VLKALAAELGLDGVIDWKGALPQDAVLALYRQADIFVPTALSDGTPVSLLEAMASGLPCIATNVGGVPEWLSDEVNGLLIPPGDVDILADRLLRLAADPELRAAYGARARRRVVDDGDWWKLMPRAEKDYEELVAGWRE